MGAVGIVDVVAGRFHRGAARAAVVPLWALAVLLAAGAAEAGAVDEIRTALHQDAGGLYQIEGSFRVQAPKGVVWRVLTDYDRLGEFVSSIRRSTVTARHTDHLILEQEGTGRVLLVTKSIHVRLVVREQVEAVIAFKDILGISFHDYAGTWRMSEADGLVTVSYALRARPAFRAPGFLARKTMRESVRDLLDEVRLEIVARGAAVAAAAR
jgi:hypothetical protein